MGKLNGYYNSELNQYIGESLPKIMTSIDLDLFQVKLSKKIIRFAEYKHLKEGTGYQQQKSLSILSVIAKKINENKNLFDGWTMEVNIIRGNHPFDYIEVEDLVYNKKQKIDNKKQIDDYLTLAYD